MTASSSLPKGKHSWLVVILTTFLSVILLFAGLGHHALWDDEAMDALNAKAIIEAGDTVDMVGSNLVAYREGLLLVNGRQQGMPPLPGYLAAASIQLFGDSPAAVRGPFAACGVITVLMIMVFAMSCGLSWLELIVVGMAILGNISFFLYFRNCHYYGPAIMLTTACLISYARGLRTSTSQVLMGIFSALLLLSNYTWLVAVYVCMGVDVLLWRREILRMGSIPTLRILTPPFIAGLLILWRWNPLGTKLGGYLHGSSLSQRLNLFVWNWRDMNDCAFVSYGILLIAVYFAVFRGSSTLRRFLTALTVYVVVITVLSTQLLEGATLSDIRYMAGALPICIGITSVVLILVIRMKQFLGWVLAVVVYTTTLLNGGQPRSLAAEYIGELLSPTEDPYQPTAQWIRENISPGSSIWVLPEYMNYPLMFHAPNAVYAWQLNPEQKKEAQFRNLPPIHFKGVTLPDYIIVFGPTVTQIRGLLEQWSQQGIQYEPIYTINTFWKDLYRPELFWRTFKPITGYDPETQAIYIFKHLISTPTSQKP